MNAAHWTPPQCWTSFGLGRDETMMILLCSTVVLSQRMHYVQLEQRKKYNDLEVLFMSLELAKEKLTYCHFLVPLKKKIPVSLLSFLPLL